MKGCRLCGCDDLKEILSLPDSIIDGKYVEVFTQEGKKYPFDLVQCANCEFVQLLNPISLNEVYDNYSFYLTNIDSIGDWVNNLSKILQDEYGMVGKSIYEVGASDGYFLSLFKEKNKVSGVEPSTQLVQSAKSKYDVDINVGYFSSQNTALYDVVFCRHVLEHIVEVKDFSLSLANAVTDNGYLYIEVPDIDAIFSTTNYSNFFHEHVNYFSSNVIEKLFHSYGFETVFYSKNSVHAGSFGFLFRKTSNFPKFTAIDLQTAIIKHKDSLNFLRDSNCVIHGYGAANKTFKLLSTLGLENIVTKIYDRNPNLIGKFIPIAQGIEILNPDSIISHKPDYIIIFATSYSNSIVKYLREHIRFNGKIIILYPEVVIL